MNQIIKHKILDEAERTNIIPNTDLDTLYKTLYDSLHTKFLRIKENYPTLNTSLEEDFYNLAKPANFKLISYELEQINKFLGRDIDVFFKSNKTYDEDIFYKNSVLPSIRFDHKIILLNPTNNKDNPKKIKLDEYGVEGVVESWKFLSPREYEKHLPWSKNSFGSKYLDLKSINDIELDTFKKGKGYLCDKKKDTLFLYNEFDEDIGTTNGIRTKYHKLQVNRRRDNNTTYVEYHGFPISRKEFESSRQKV